MNPAGATASYADIAKRIGKPAAVRAVAQACSANRIAVAQVKHGEGRVVLLGFRAQHRAQTHGTFKFLFNSLVGPSPQGAAMAAGGG